MYAEAMNNFRRSDRVRMTLEASLVNGDKVLDTQTINISDTGVLLKAPVDKSVKFSAGELMQLHIHGFISKKSGKTSVFPVLFVREDEDAIALEFL